MARTKNLPKAQKLKEKTELKKEKEKIKKVKSTGKKKKQATQKTAKETTPKKSKKFAKKLPTFKESRYPLDFILVVLLVILIIFGTAMIISASYYSSMNINGNPYKYAINQVIWVLSGFVGMYMMSIIDCHKYRKFAPVLMVITIALLAMIFIPGLGKTTNNATRWIEVGPITLMPGEIAKLSITLFTAWWLSKKTGIIKSFKEGIAPVSFVAAVTATLIVLQPNMSTALTVLAIAGAMMFIAGISWKWLGGVLSFGIVTGILMLVTDTSGYRMERVTTFLNPFADPLGDGYQVVQSLLALGGGGLSGRGIGASIQKSLYLPEPQNDFILAIIGEELGFVGILGLFILYILIVWRCIKITMDAKDIYSTLLAGGITAMFAIQIILNVAVVTSSMPPTGIILPLVSYGGNATWLFMGAFGIMLNISRQGHKVDPIAREERIQ